MILSASFFGHSELGVRLLSLRSVADYVRREERAEGEALAEEMTLRDALSLFVARGCEVLPVVNTQGALRHAAFSGSAGGGVIV